MLNSNATCLIRRRTGYDLHGQPKVACDAKQERCAVVELRTEAQHTTVRADSSQSRGHGDEFIEKNMILLGARTVCRVNDQLTVHGHVIKVTSMRERFDVTGRLDHYECKGEVWA